MPLSLDHQICTNCVPWELTEPYCKLYWLALIFKVIWALKWSKLAKNAIELGSPNLHQIGTLQQPIENGVNWPWPSWSVTDKTVQIGIDWKWLVSTITGLFRPRGCLAPNAALLCIMIDHGNNCIKTLAKLVSPSTNAWTEVCVKFSSLWWQGGSNCKTPQ